MCWDCDEAAWCQGYDHLKRYALTHGNTKVPLSYIEPDGYRLGTWLGQKRVQYKKGNLSAEHIRALEELGVAWDALEERWQTGYEHAMWYARANGHLNVPKNYRTPDGYNLFNWLDAARRKMKTQKLDAQKVRMLTGLERDAV